MKKNNLPNREGGFTLIELIACLGIFAVVTGVVLYNYSQFNSNVLITNYAYDVALTIRQAQIFGTAVRERAASTGVFGSSYGVHFDTSPQNSFVYYADLNLPGHIANYYDKDNGQVPPAGGNESLEIHSLPGSYVFSNFCAIAGTTKHCENGTPGNSLSALDISFKRPEPDAIISAVPSGVFNQATVCIKSPLGKTRQVVIDQTGQISVAPTPDETCQ